MGIAGYGKHPRFGIIGAGAGVGAGNRKNVFFPDDVHGFTQVSGAGGISTKIDASHIPPGTGLRQQGGGAGAAHGAGKGMHPAGPTIIGPQQGTQSSNSGHSSVLSLFSPPFSSSALF